MRFVPILTAAGLMHETMSDAPLRPWETTGVSRNVRPRMKVGTTQLPPYNEYPEATAVPLTVGHADGSGLASLDAMMSLVDSWNEFLIDPSKVNRLRDLVRDLSLSDLRSSRPRSEVEALHARVAGSDAYKTLRHKVHWAMEAFGHSVGGVWLEVAVLHIEALQIVHALIRSSELARVQGWEFDQIRWGFNQQGIRLRPNPTQLDRVVILAGYDLINDRFNTSARTPLETVLEDLRARLLVESIDDRVRNRHIAAVIKVFGGHARERINAALQISGAREAMREGCRTVGPPKNDGWLESDDTDGLAHRLLAGGAAGMASAVAKYFKTAGPDAVWEFTDSTRTTIRPRGSRSIKSHKSKRWYYRQLRACGRIIGAGLAYNFVPGLKLSPAVLALLQTPGMVDLEAIAEREDPRASAAIEARRNVTWTDRRAVDRAFRGKTIDGEIPINSTNVGMLIRRDKIKRLVLRIDIAMRYVRQGIDDSVILPGLVDLLSPADLEGAIRGIDTLTPNIVLTGSGFNAPDEYGRMRGWLAETIRAMSSVDLTQLVTFMRHDSQPPIDHAHERWLWFEVNVTAPMDSDCRPSRRGVLTLPPYTSQAALETKLLSVIYAPAVGEH